MIGREAWPCLRAFASVVSGLLLAGALSSCAATAQVTEINPGVYSLNVGAMGIEGGEAGARNKAFSAASAYCAALGRRLSVQRTDSRGPVEWGSAAGSASVVFTCIAPEPAGSY